MRMEWTLLVAMVFATESVFGQGQFVFNNRVPPEINAPIRLANGALPGATSDIYTLELVGGPTGSASSGWIDLGSTTFRTGNAAGYVNPITVTVPGATTSADFTFNIFQGTSITGTSFQQYAVVITTPVAIAPNPPPNAPLGTAPIVVGLPEPSTFQLALLGFGAILLCVAQSRVNSRKRMEQIERGHTRFLIQRLGPCSDEE